MSALAAFKSAAVGIDLGRGIGAAIKFSACRRSVPSRNTRQAGALGPSAHGRRLAPWHSGSQRAERVANVALQARGSHRVSSSYRRRASQSGSFTPVTRRLNDNDRRQCSLLGSHGNFQRGREAVSVIQGLAYFAPPRTTPNPSLKRSANGRPPGPGLWHTVHFHSPGPGVLPSSPA